MAIILTLTIQCIEAKQLHFSEQNCTNCMVKQALIKENKLKHMLRNGGTDTFSPRSMVGGGRQTLSLLDINIVFFQYDIPDTS